MQTSEFVYSFIEKAKENPKKIVLPEGDDERIISAAIEIVNHKYAKIIILGNYKEIEQKINSIDKTIQIDNNWLTIIDPMDCVEYDNYANSFYELRKHKGLTLEDAKKKLNDKSYFGAMLVHENVADGMVAGANTPSSHTFKPALQIVKTKKGIKTASSFFFMILQHKILFYADCGFNIQPTTEQLADIAIVSNDSAKAFNLDPKVALLSFSTHGSGKHSDADKVKDALKIVQENRPDISIDGEMQFDAAIVPTIAKKKCPDSKVAGQANILIFPDLDAGNIGYKITERLAHAMALGPITQGLNKPINDLSRGCNMNDIVNIVCITSVQAGMNLK